MDDTFLYILGAGASCEAVPLVKGFPKSLAEFADELELVRPASNSPTHGIISGVVPNFSLFDHEEPLNPVEQFIAGEGRKSFVEALRWLATEADCHASVDTLAKKFFLKGDHRNLGKLKAVLSAFLIARQTRKPVDKRYDSFFASVLYPDGAGELQIPSNIRILTWNYDTQLEKAFFGFADNSAKVYRQITTNDRIHRVNGYCGRTPDNVCGPEFRDVWETPYDSSAMVNGIGLFNDYVKEHNAHDPDIRFAWESPTKAPLERYTLPNLKETTVAVSIGYSFPYFNREIDKQIFSALPNLKRVYLQYLEGTHKTIRERVHAMRPDLNDIREVPPDDKHFYIPDEYAGPPT